MRTTVVKPADVLGDASSNCVRVRQTRSAISSVLKVSTEALGQGVVIGWVADRGRQRRARRGRTASGCSRSWCIRSAIGVMHELDTSAQAASRMNAKNTSQTTASQTSASQTSGKAARSSAPACQLALRHRPPQLSRMRCSIDRLALVLRPSPKTRSPQPQGPVRSPHERSTSSGGTARPPASVRRSAAARRSSAATGR